MTAASRRPKSVRKPLTLEERYPQVEVDPQVLAAAKGLLPKLRAFVSRSWELSYSWVYSDGSHRELLQYPCYGPLQHKDKRESGKPDPVLFCTYRMHGTIRLGDEMDFETGRPFLEWLLNESIYARVFVTKDAREAWYDGIICTMNYPAVLVLQACAIARYPKELPEIVRWWYRLAKHIDKHAALILAHYLQHNNADPNTYLWTDVKITNAFFDPGQIGVQELTRMVNGDLSNLTDKPFSKQQGPYQEFTRIFRKSGVVGKERDIIKDGPGLTFSGAVLVERLNYFGERYFSAHFQMPDLEQNAKRFFEENYAGKDYA
jgi:hypothetical protein